MEWAECRDIALRSTCLEVERLSRRTGALLAGAEATELEVVLLRRSGNGNEGGRVGGWVAGMQAGR